VGKTELALEVAFRFAADNSDCSVFWLCARTNTSIRNSLLEVARVLGISDTNQDGLMESVVYHLNHENLGAWLLIIDGADDLQHLLKAKGKGLEGSLPRCPMGSILITARDPVIKAQFENADSTVLIHLGNPEPFQVATWARKWFLETPHAIQLMVEGLPLRSARAIKALIFLISLGVSPNRNLPSRLRHEINMDHVRRHVDAVPHSGNTGADSDDEYIIAHITKLARTSLAELPWTYLAFLSLMSETEVPKSFFQRKGSFDNMVVEVLKRASFIRARQNDTSFDVAPEVRLAVRKAWEPRRMLDAPARSIMEHLVSVLPPPTAENRDTWLQYQPHVQEVLKFRKLSACQDTVAVLASLLAQSYVEFGS
jgi:hypothetical protein